jgi:hypothetical protein
MRNTVLLCRGVNDGLDYNQVQELIDDLNIGRNRGVSEPRLQQAFNDADVDHDGYAQTWRVHCPLCSRRLLCCISSHCGRESDLINVPASVYTSDSRRRTTP